LQIKIQISIKSVLSLNALIYKFICIFVVEKFGREFENDKIKEREFLILTYGFSI